MLWFLEKTRHLGRSHGRGQTGLQPVGQRFEPARLHLNSLRFAVSFFMRIAGDRCVETGGIRLNKLAYLVVIDALK